MKRTLIIIMALLLASCSADNNNNNTNNKNINEGNAPQTKIVETDDAVYDKTSLSEFNGKDGQPAYIAIEGIVYDVSDNPMWMNGIHQGRFEAGQDLTEEMKNAPHGFSKLSQLNEVGIYED